MKYQVIKAVGSFSQTNWGEIHFCALQQDHAGWRGRAIYR
jgi:hypothetical protein